MRPFSFHRSISVADAIAAHGESPDHAYVAGGTTLIDLVKLDVMRPAEVVDINRLPLDAIERPRDGGLRIGALVRNSTLAWHDDVRRDYPVLSEALLSGASPQLRNMATTAGNIMQRTRCPYFRDNISACNKREPGSGCAALEGYNRSHALFGTSNACIATHPSDMCVAMAALDARIIVAERWSAMSSSRSPGDADRSPTGTSGPTAGEAGEREIAFTDFHRLPGDTPHVEHELRPGELITAVTLPPPLSGARHRYVKLRDRESYEFALASAAVIVACDGGRIREARLALGGVATKPWRAFAAEAVLRGGLISPSLFAAAADAALRDARPRQHNAFKLTLARQAILRALEETTQPL